MIKLVLRVMVRMVMIRDGAICVRKYGNRMDIWMVERVVRMSMRMMLIKGWSEWIGVWDDKNGVDDDGT